MTTTTIWNLRDSNVVVSFRVPGGNAYNVSVVPGVLTVPEHEVNVVGVGYVRSTEVSNAAVIIAPGVGQSVEWSISDTALDRGMFEHGMWLGIACAAVLAGIIVIKRGLSAGDWS